MRLLHLGFDVYVVGETVTPALQPCDTMVVFSGSGETHSMVTFCNTVKDSGGNICLITASPESTMSRIADCVVNLGDLTGYYRGDTFHIRDASDDRAVPLRGRPPLPRSEQCSRPLPWSSRTRSSQP